MVRSSCTWSWPNITISIFFQKIRSTHMPHKRIAWGGFFSHATFGLGRVWWCETIQCCETRQSPNSLIGFLVPGRVVAVFVADAAFGIARTYKLSFEEGWYFASSQVTQATRNIIYSAFAGCRLPFVDTVLNIRASHSGVDSSRLFLLMFPAGVTQ